jgi:hypothetical protein
MTRTHAITAICLVLGVAVIAFFWPTSSPEISDAGETSEKPANIESTAPLPAPKMSPPKVKVAKVDGEEHKFVERFYEPPFVLPQFTEPPQSNELKTVEATLAVYTSAMQQSNWDWWFSMWDKKSQSVIAQMDQYNNGHTGKSHLKKNMLSGWKQFYAGHRHELVSRIEIPGYTIVYLRREGEPDDSRELLAPVVLKKAAERWVMTHDLQEHIVPNLKITDRNVQIRTLQ